MGGNAAAGHPVECGTINGNSRSVSSGENTNATHQEEVEVRGNGTAVPALEKHGSSTGSSFCVQFGTETGPTLLCLPLFTVIFFCFDNCCRVSLGNYFEN